jgi:hypothetical protein
LLRRFCIGDGGSAALVAIVSVWQTYSSEVSGVGPYRNLWWSTQCL